MTWTDSKRLPVLAVAAAAAVGSTLALTHRSGASRNLDARSAFAVFHSLPPSPPPAEVARSPSMSGGDIAETRLLGAGLGRFHSRLFIYPANGDRSICFGLIAAGP